MFRAATITLLLTTLAAGCTASLFSRKAHRWSPRLEGLAVVAVGAAGGAFGYGILGKCAGDEGCHEERDSTSFSDGLSNGAKGLGEDIGGMMMGVGLAGSGALDVAAGLYQIASGRYLFSSRSAPTH